MIKLMVLLMTSVLLLVGCSPGIVANNPRSIVINNQDIFNLEEVHRLANAHCQRYGRYAIHRSDNVRDGKMTFECVE